MEKLLFIASIQYGEPPTGGGAQAKNQLLLAHLQKYYDVRFFDTWNKCSAVSLLSAIFYIIVFNRKCVLSISGRGALSIGKLLSFLHIRRLIIYCTSFWMSSWRISTSLWRTRKTKSRD